MRRPRRRPRVIPGIEHHRLTLGALCSVHDLLGEMQANEVARAPPCLLTASPDPTKALPQPASPHLTSPHLASHRIASHRTASHRIASHRTASPWWGLVCVPQVYDILLFRFASNLFAQRLHALPADGRALVNAAREHAIHEGAPHERTMPPTAPLPGACAANVAVPLPLGDLTAEDSAIFAGEPLNSAARPIGPLPP